MFTKYLKSLLSFILIYGVLAFCTLYFALPRFYTNFFWLLLLVFAVVTAASHYTMLKQSVKNSKNFPMFIMANMVVKMVLYFFVVFILILGWRSEIRAILVTFMFLYFGFSIFETYQLQKINKTRSKNQNSTR